MTALAIYLFAALIVLSCYFIMNHFLLQFSGLYYEIRENNVYQKMCFEAAHQLAKGTSKRTYITTMLSGPDGIQGKHSSKGEKSDQYSSRLTVTNTGELA